MGLGDIIARDIKERFASSDFANEVGEQTGKVHLDSIKDQTKNAKSARGTDFKDLSPSYAQWKSKNVGSSRADLRSGKRFPDGASKPRAMDNLIYEPDGKMIDFNFSGYGQAEEYMAEHQLGTTKLPERKWFPDSKTNDDNTPPQRVNAEKVEKIIERYINEDRTVRFTTTING